MSFVGRLLIVVAALSTACIGQAAEANKPDGELRYNRDIRPIFAENCFSCHGPDSASRKADLRLDKRDAAINAGAIDLGKPDDSGLITRIFSTDPDEVMPPAATHKVLTDSQKEKLKRWIAAGAPYEPHWSLIEPRRPEPPAVENKSWVKSPIDQFILAKLEQAGLKPAPEADRRTLARRASLDLTGLPPDPAEVEQFVNDPAPDAYEKYVELLLAKPEWGEHRGRYWLDAARYADTHGIHFDNYREIWSYRDRVIRAFNDNMPFDQFTIEQIAGDLLPNRSLDQQVGSGFNRCNITTSEGGAIDEEYLVLYARDRTETTSQVWLGLTAGCAVCHDHKFDALSQKEFYELSAFFNNTTQRAMDGNVRDTPPIMPVPLLDERKRWGELNDELVILRNQIDGRKQAARPDFEKWLAANNQAQATSQIPTEGLRVHAPLNEGSGNTVNVTIDGQTKPFTSPANIDWDPAYIADRSPQVQSHSLVEVPEAGDLEKDQPFSCSAWIKVDKVDQRGVIVARLNEDHDYRGWDFLVTKGRLTLELIHAWGSEPVHKDALIANTSATLGVGEWHHVLARYDGSGNASQIKFYVDGVIQPSTVTGESGKLTGTIRTDAPLTIGARYKRTPLEGGQIQEVRLYNRELSDDEIWHLAKDTRMAWLVNKPANQRSNSENDEIYGWWVGSKDPESRELSERLRKVEQEKNAIAARGTIAYVMQERDEAAQAFVLFRGEYDKRRDQVTPDTPDVMPPMSSDLPRNRLGLAKWLLRPDHPLTARVTVNRFWQEVFGTGIVRTTGDLGVSGELPSHPELLDWLAVDFREGGWDVKRFFRVLVTSAAYRQAAVATPEKLEKDLQNRLLSRGPRFRMDAEMIRDSALAASGLLVRKIGGPSVRPYQPEGVWEAVTMIGSNTREYKRDSGENLYRRSLYTFWKRSAPPAAMDIFNAPSRETCAVRRDRTDTPLQALVTLNDPQFVEAARSLAQTVLKSEGNANTRVQLLATRLLARPLRAEELDVVKTSLIELLGYYAGHAEDAQKLIAVGESKPDPSVSVPVLAAWTMLTNELMNLDEVLNK